MEQLPLSSETELADGKKERMREQGAFPCTNSNLKKKIRAELSLGYPSSTTTSFRIQTQPAVPPPTSLHVSFFLCFAFGVFLWMVLFVIRL